MQQIAGFIVVLGSPNDSNGVLSSIAEARLLKGIQEHKVRKASGWKFLLTGGFGEHFNTTNKPHAYFAKNFLISQGISETDIVEFAESRDTVDDALKSVPIVEKYQVKELLVISSDFHIPRVEYIFQTVFPNSNLSFVAADYLPSCSVEESEKLLAHEERELKSLKETGKSALVGIPLFE